jgi:hypothetical protein
MLANKGLITIRIVSTLYAREVAESRVERGWKRFSWTEPLGGGWGYGD